MDIRKRNGKSGMTLIEILIVIALLGVLAGVLVKSLSSSLDSGKKASAKLFCESTMGTAIASFKLMNSKLPEKWSDLQSYITLDSDDGTAPKDPDGNSYYLAQVKLKTSGSPSVELPCVVVTYKQDNPEIVLNGATGADVAALRTDAMGKVKTYNETADNVGVAGVHF